MSQRSFEIAPRQSNELKARFEEYQKLEGELQDIVAKKQGFITKFNENKIVETELNGLTDSNKVFKQVGPVLIKQDVDEAKSMVQSRINLIVGQMDALDKDIKAIHVKRQSMGQEILALQKKQQEKAAAENAQE